MMVELILKMLTWNPRERPSARECLAHPAFKGFVLPTKKNTQAERDPNKSFEKSEIVR